MEIPKIRLEKIELHNLLRERDFEFDFTKESLVLSHDTADKWYGLALKIETIYSIFNYTLQICKFGLTYTIQSDIVDPDEESYLRLYFIDEDDNNFLISIDIFGESGSRFLKAGMEYIDLDDAALISKGENLVLDSTRFFFENSIFLDKRFPKELFEEEKDNLEGIYKNMVYEYFPEDCGKDIKYDPLYNKLKIGPFSVNEMGSGFKKMVELYPSLLFSKKYGLPVFVTNFDECFHPILTKKLLKWYGENNTMGRIVGRLQGL